MTAERSFLPIVAFVLIGTCFGLPSAKAEEASDMAKKLGTPRGLCVVVSEDPNAAFALGLARASELTIVLASPKPEMAAAARVAAERAGLLGTRFFVVETTEGRIP